MAKKNELKKDELTTTMRRIKIDGKVYIIEDAPLDAYINVTQRHIDRGIPKDPRACMIALAGHDSLGTELAVIWKTRALFEAPNGRMIRYYLAAKTQQFIETVDNDLPVKPARLKLLAPRGTHRLGFGTHTPGERPTGRRTGERLPRVWRGPRGNLSLRGETVTVTINDA